MFEKKSAIYIIAVVIIFFASSVVHSESEIELCQKAMETNKYTEAFSVCSKAAVKGSHDAELVLAYLYSEGLGVEKDASKALEIIKSTFLAYQNSAEKGVIESQIFLGDCHSADDPAPDSADYVKSIVLKNMVCKKDYVEAAKWYRKAAEKGRVDALNKLVDMFSDNKLLGDYRDAKLPGGDIEAIKNIDAVIAVFRKVAEHGGIDEFVALGDMYYFKHDYDEGLKWFGMAAAKGSVRAQQRINGIYKRSSGTWMEKDAAFLRAENGDAKAQYDLAIKFDGGIYGQDYAEALIWYERSAWGNNTKAKIKLAEIYENGRGVKQDYDKAVEWYQKAAASGNAEAQLKLGVMYANGQGVPQNYIVAARRFRESAEQGNEQAQVNLGKAYYLGQGVPKVYSEAILWFQNAAEQGNTDAQLFLGTMYSTGDGVPLDLITSFAWINNAATAGSIGGFDIGKIRNDLENRLKPAEIEKAQQLSAQIQLTIEKNVAAKQAAFWAELFNEEKDSVKNHENAKSHHPKISLPAAVAHVFTPNDIAIIIGIEKYRSVPPTEYAAADAGMVRDYLKALGIPERNIEFLADDRATLSDIRKVIETKLPNMVKANSRVIVYYAGHGAPGTTKGESYLVPYDGDPSFLADTAYPLSRLYDRLSRLNAKEVLVILDSCFSGAGGRSVLAKNTRPLVMVKDTPPPTSKKVIVMTSSRGNQITTSLPETGHGAFTYFFLRALQEGNRDIGEVYAYLNPRVTEEAKRQNVDQTPTISPAADKLKGRFLFAR